MTVAQVESPESAYLKAIALARLATNHPPANQYLHFLLTKLHNNNSLTKPKQLTQSDYFFFTER